MSRNILRTIYLALLVLSLAALAWPKDQPVCTMATRAGEYGHVWSGTMYLPTGAVPAAGIGRSTFDEAGNFSSTQVTSRGGTISQITTQGTYTLNPDCTGTLAASNYDLSGNLLNTVTWAIVSVNNMNEARLIMTSMKLANGVDVPVVITMESKKLFPIPENKVDLSGKSEASR